MTKDVRLCAWLLLLNFVVLLTASHFGGFAPPPPPDITAQALAEIYHARSMEIMIFAVSMSLACTLSLPSYGAVAVAMRRLQPRSLFLPLMYFIGAIFAVGGPFFSAMFWAAAAFNPNSSPDVIQALHNMGVMFNQATSLPALVQGGAIAVAIFRDKSPDPILPKWLGWVYILYGVFSVPGAFTVFFKDGPFAWNGSIGLGSPTIVLFLWMFGTAAALFRIKPHHWAEAEQA